MNEIDLARIEQILARVVDEKLGDVSARFDTKVETIATSVDQKLNQFKKEVETIATTVDQKLNQFKKEVETIAANVDQKLNQFKKEIVDEFSHQIKLQTEDFQQGLLLWRKVTRCSQINLIG